MWWHSAHHKASRDGNRNAVCGAVVPEGQVMMTRTTGAPSWRDGAALGARVLIGVLFAGGAVQKIMDPAAS